jgi:hypothetical protein
VSKDIEINYTRRWVGALGIWHLGVGVLILWYLARAMYLGTEIMWQL